MKLLACRIYVWCSQAPKSLITMRLLDHISDCLNISGKTLSIWKYENWSPFPKPFKIHIDVTSPHMIRYMFMSSFFNMFSSVLILLIVVSLCWFALLCFKLLYFAMFCFVFLCFTLVRVASLCVPLLRLTLICFAWLCFALLYFA